MNIAELRVALERDGIDPERYCLDPREMGNRLEAYRIGIHQKHWCVWYFERGIMFDEHRFASEDDACRYLLELMRQQEAPDLPPGGRMNRLGTTVARPGGPWTAAVAGLLTHLADVGFEGAPQPEGYDQSGRLLVTYLPGEVAGYPLPDIATTDQTLVEVAQLLRLYHDATVGFVPPDGAVWQRQPRRPAEVICHGDLGPHHTVFRNGHPVAFTGFDRAHPGPRHWDVAWAAYRFAPLTAPSNPDFTLPIDRQMIRLRQFCDAYGLDHADRDAVPELVVQQLRGELARLAGADYGRRLEREAGVLRDDIAHVEANATQLIRALRI